MSSSTPLPAPARAVDVHGLTKRYGRHTVVDSLDIVIPTGSVTGLIGPNGAGKTTVMAMLLGLVRPSAGAGTVLGMPLHHPTAYLHRVGALIEGPAFFAGLSADDNLTYLARLGGHDRSRLRELIELVGLSGRERELVGAYSMGMKQRLAIAAALLPDPELVILDEPSNGVDPVGMRDLRAVIGEIAAQDRTVLVSSHLLSELEQVCDHLVVIDRGGLVHRGTAQELPRSGLEALELTPAVAEDLARLADLLGVGRPAGRQGESLLIPTAGRSPRVLAAQVNEQAHRAGIVLAELTHRHADLESRYLELVGEAAPRVEDTEGDHQ